MNIKIFQLYCYFFIKENGKNRSKSNFSFDEHKMNTYFIHFPESLRVFKHPTTIAVKAIKSYLFKIKQYSSMSRKLRRISKVKISIINETKKLAKFKTMMLSIREAV